MTRRSLIFPKYTDPGGWFRSSARAAEPRRNESVVEPDEMWALHILCGGADQTMREAFEDLPETFASFLLTPDPDSVLRLGRYCDNDTLLVINVDRFEDTQEAVESLLEMRRINAFVSVLIASHDFSSNNGGPQRSVICDGSVRLPVTPCRLLEAVKEAHRTSQFRLGQR